MRTYTLGGVVAMPSRRLCDHCWASADTAINATAPSSTEKMMACTVVLGCLPPNSDDGMLRLAKPSGTSAPATTVRHVRLHLRNEPVLSAFPRTSNSTRMVTTIGPRAAKMKILVMGTRHGSGGWG